MTTWNLATDFGAAVAPTDSSPALASWLAAAADGDTLVIPGDVGQHYHWASTNGPTNGLRNATIIGRGATVDSLFIGHSGLIVQDYNHSARIQTVSPGATSVTLVTPAQISRFTVGKWVLIAGPGTQAGASYPPNFENYEFRQVAGISGGTFSFTDRLLFGYKSTWPLADPGLASNYDLGGPATAYALADEFDGVQTYSGLTVTGTAGVGINCAAGRSLILDNMDFSANNGPSPSIGKSIVIKNSKIGAQNEVDKCVEYLEYNNCTGTQILCASACPQKLLLDRVTLTSLNGTAYRTIIRNESSITTLFGGAAGFGRSRVILISSDSTIGTAQTAAHQIALSDLSFSRGTFTVANAGNLYDAVRMFVPGFQYLIGYNAGDNLIHVTDNLGAQHPFKVLNMTQDGVNTYFLTDLAAIPTGVTFFGQSANAIFCYATKALFSSVAGLSTENAFVEPTTAGDREFAAHFA